jgi:hypothetical protein
MAEANAAAEPRDVRVPVIARRGPRSFSWWDLVLLPVHCAAILSTTKSFRNNPVIGSPVLNRRGLHVIRRRLAARLGAQRRRSLAGLLPAEDREAFERDGFIVKPNFLDEATFQAFRDEIMGLNVDAREALIGDTLTRLIPLDGHTLRRLPTVQSVLEGSDYRGLLAYVGSDTFHPTLKSWFFLQDVEEDGAPFTYVPGSHRPNQRRLAWERKISIIAHSAGDRLTAEGSLRISEAEILRLGYGAPRKVPVAANTLVVADTSGIHRRSRTERQTTRVSIWAYSRSNPFLPWAGGDIAAPLVIRGHAMLIYWAMADRLRDARRVQRDWHWVGRRSPLTPPRS